jgi:hypothetical protein
VAFQGWGNALHLFSKFWWYDNSVHITLPMSLAPILYVGFSRLDVVPDPARRTGSSSELAGMGLIATSRAQGRLDIAAVRASAGRVEWRPSLPMLYAVIAEFEGDGT